MGEAATPTHTNLTPCKARLPSTSTSPGTTWLPGLRGSRAPVQGSYIPTCKEPSRLGGLPPFQRQGKQRPASGGGSESQSQVLSSLHSPLTRRAIAAGPQPPSRPQTETARAGMTAQARLLPPHTHSHSCMEPQAPRATAEGGGGEQSEQLAGSGWPHCWPLCASPSALCPLSGTLGKQTQVRHPAGTMRGSGQRAHNGQLGRGSLLSSTQPLLGHRAGSSPA